MPYRLKIETFKMSAEAVVVDANLLVLLVVGLASESYITRHKRLKAYSVADYRLLLALISAHSRMIVTPNAVTETSNLVRNIAEPACTHILQVLGVLLEEVEERYIASRDAARHQDFRRLGITDAALLNDSLQSAVLLTSDLDLYLAAARAGQKVVNFTHHIEANRPSA